MAYKDDVHLENQSKFMFGELQEAFYELVNNLKKLS